MLYFDQHCEHVSTLDSLYSYVQLQLTLYETRRLSSWLYFWATPKFVATWLPLLAIITTSLISRNFLTMINNQMPTYDKIKFVCYKKIVFQLPYFSNIWVVVPTWAKAFHMLYTACKCKAHSKHYRLQNFSTRTTHDTRNDIKLFCVA